MEKDMSDWSVEEGGLRQDAHLDILRRAVGVVGRGGGVGAVLQREGERQMSGPDVADVPGMNVSAAGFASLAMSAVRLRSVKSGKQWSLSTSTGAHRAGRLEEDKRADRHGEEEEEGDVVLDDEDSDDECVIIAPPLPEAGGGGEPIKEQEEHDEEEGEGKEEEEEEDGSGTNPGEKARRKKRRDRFRSFVKKRMLAGKAALSLRSHLRINPMGELEATPSSLPPEIMHRGLRAGCTPPPPPPPPSSLNSHADAYSAYVRDPVGDAVYAGKDEGAHQQQHHQEEEEEEEEEDDDDDDDDESKVGKTKTKRRDSWLTFPPAVLSKKNIVMLVVGTRGDVQPFISIGKKLLECGHRVRLATHGNFREFVTQNGLEFYPLGGDPKVLAEYMVKNGGLLPSGTAQIVQQRKQLKAIVKSTIKACTEPDPYPGSPPGDFPCDAIMANPPSLGHTHVSEKLRKPLHMVFTMPWSATSKWPHPLARIPSLAMNRSRENRLSYAMVDAMMWMGIGGIINRFRTRVLSLSSIHGLRGPCLDDYHVPFSYIWSRHLAPKPKDWEHNPIDIAGFCFLELRSNYTPPQDLLDFLEGGEEPVFIGFGSLPVERPAHVTRLIVEALLEEGRRGIIQKGWGGLGSLSHDSDSDNEHPDPNPRQLLLPPSVYLIDNCPHDWLFPRCSAVIHHGGAGTTAAGLKAGRPTTVIPFFGDQPFWGDCVHARGVGPRPIPIKELTKYRLREALKVMQLPETKRKALELSAKLNGEDGATRVVQYFHHRLAQGGTIIPEYRSFSRQIFSTFHPNKSSSDSEKASRQSSNSNTELAVAVVPTQTDKLKEYAIESPRLIERLFWRRS